MSKITAWAGISTARDVLQLRVNMLAWWYGRPPRRVRDSEVRYAVLLSRCTPLSLNAAASLVAEHGRLARAVAFGRMARGKA